MKKTRIKGIVVLLMIFCSLPVLANDLYLSDGTVIKVDAGSGKATVQFNLSWENSWKDSVNHDAVWLFMKYSTDSGNTWGHATLAAAGVDPTGFSAGTGVNLEMEVPGDRKGCFLRRSWTGSGKVVSENVKLVWAYTLDGLSEGDVNNADIKIFGIEMVYVPAGSFHAGDYEVSNASFSQGRDMSETDPWYIQSEAAIFVTNAQFNGFYYRSAGNGGENATGSEFIISDSFPKGFRAFYCMKYEITEEQWVDLFNTLTAGQKAGRDITGPSGKNTSGTAERNTVSVSGGRAFTSRPERACGYLSWMDVAAYADWAALRPMTELEFEKAARGKDIAALGGEYAWGTTSLTAALALSGPEDGSETVATPGANVCYGDHVLSGGDGGKGPLRAGIFAKSGTTRVAAGSSYYGIMEFSGNLWERTVSVGNAQGRSFLGSHGDGVLTAAGNASIPDWPGYAEGDGVSRAEGSGLRGGSYAETVITSQAVSDRSEAADGSILRRPDAGGRCVRTTY
jgi:formylglycine-generating enzyme required for sulfatase activity